MVSWPLCRSVVRLDSVLDVARVQHGANKGRGRTRVRVFALRRYRGVGPRRGEAAGGRGIKRDLMPVYEIKRAAAAPVNGRDAA